MRTLYHYPLCPFSRKVRLVLAEKKLDYGLEMEKFWERRPEFININYAGTVPVLTDLNGTHIAESTAIVEYLEDAYPAPALLPEDLSQRAEARRLMSWFDDRFAREISLALAFEKSFKRHYDKTSSPNSTVIRESKQKIHQYMEIISWLVDHRRWLAGDQLSLADLTAAAHLSIIDYLGDVPWEHHPIAKDWYARIKSRPSFRSLLTDQVPGQKPVAHYTDLDF